MTREGYLPIGQQRFCTRDDEANSFRTYALAIRRATMLDVGEISRAAYFSLSRDVLYRNPFINSLFSEFLTEFPS